VEVCDWIEMLLIRQERLDWAVAEGRFEAAGCKIKQDQMQFEFMGQLTPTK
jgi:hypothetical protein